MRLTIYSLVLVMVLCGTVLVVLYNQEIKNNLLYRYYDSSRKYSEVVIPVSPSLPPTTTGTTDDVSDLYSKDGQELFSMCRQESCLTTYPFKNTIQIYKARILYYGIPGLTKDTLFQSGGVYVDKNQIIPNCDSKTNICDYYFRGGLKTNSLTVELRNGGFNNYGIGEIRFQDASRKDIITSYFDFIFVWGRSPLVYFLLPLLFFIFFLSPGLIIQELIRNRFTTNNSILSTTLLSVVFFLVFSLFGFLLPAVLIKTVFLVLLVSFIVFFHKSSVIKEIISRERIVIAGMIISILTLAGIMYVQDFPAKLNPITSNDFYKSQDLSVAYGAYKTDFLIPYQSALNFQAGGSALNKKIGAIYNITDRTPAISFVYLLFGKTFGLNLFSYQIFIIVLSSLFLLPFYYLARQFLDNFKSGVLVFMAGLSNFFIFTTLFGPAKTATLFFILASAYYLLRKNISTGLAGICLGLAYFFHPFALIYFISFSCYIILQNWKFDRIKLIKTLIIFSLPLLIIVSGWTIYSHLIGNENRVYSSVVSGDSWDNSSVKIGGGSGKSSPSVFLTGEYWANKGLNALGLFTNTCKCFPEEKLFDFFKLTIPGSVGLVGSVALGLGLLRRRKTILEIKQSKILFGTFILAPLILILLYQGFFIRMGLMWYAIPIIPFILIFLASFYNRAAMVIIGLLSVSESLYLFLIYDKTRYHEVSEFFGGGGVFVFLVYLVVLALYLILIRVLINEKNS